MTWAELVREFEGKPSVTAIGGDAFSLWWRVAGDRGAQKLVVLHAAVADLGCVIILAPLGEEDALPHREALGYSGTLSFGALMLHDGTLMLKVSTLLDGIDATELETLLRYAAGTATELQRRMGLPRPADEILGWMGE